MTMGMLMRRHRLAREAEAVPDTQADAEDAPQDKPARKNTSAK